MLGRRNDAGVAQVAQAVVAALEVDDTTGLLVCDPVLDPEGRVEDFVYVHQNATASSLLQMDALVGRRMLEVFPDLARSELMTTYRCLAATGGRAVTSSRFEAMRSHLDGHSYEIAADARSGLLVLLFRDVTAAEDAKAALAALAANERRFRALVEQATDVIHLIDSSGRTIYASPALGRILGYSPSEVSALPFTAFVDPDDLEQARSGWEAVRSAGPEQLFRWSAHMRTSTGESRWCEVSARNKLSDPSIAAVVVNWHDVTERRELEVQLAHDATHDPLTGLPNRRLMGELVEHAIARSVRGTNSAGLLFCDVDHFKVVNDTLGHAAGDDLLVQLGRRLREALRPGDVVGRFGGDEFVVLCEDLTEVSDLFAVAERAQEALHGEYVLDGRVATVSVSVGLTTLERGGSLRRALSEADAALYEAKRTGRARIEVFDRRLRVQLEHRLETEGLLRGAIGRGELELHYQPIVDLRDGRLVRVEGLLRWRRDGELLAPGSFLPVAEETGLIVDVGAWVLRSGFCQAAAWAAALDEPPVVCLNVAARELADPGLLRRVDALLEEFPQARGRVELEVSERLLAADTRSVGPVLQAFAERGLLLALDDFGAGNTSLTWLQHLPLDVLKLDRALVEGLPGESHVAIVGALTQLAERLGIRTVAEGIETGEQLTSVVELGCSYGQGFHLARPAPVGDLDGLLGGRGLAPWARV
ncbi:PAS domain S-box-containing protein/diguanylate cyclase (GGDEF)-like protein [Motilibacter peucedani]|uniref:PAS domain S-box-containing protein/diguanylate cyclase (GGDEF)-like protein n=1 Tax=Motilibacter peucedani TaxID=598650 RepID=A0A420XR48_9ACTN|nr:PAS domain S-box-containing protein/diguanylate cyclase (GGDEF)-like protein [Motilibacter peucedani]